MVAMQFLVCILIRSLPRVASPFNVIALGRNSATTGNKTRRVGLIPGGGRRITSSPGTPTRTFPAHLRVCAFPLRLAVTCGDAKTKDNQVWVGLDRKSAQGFCRSLLLSTTRIAWTYRCVSSRIEPGEKASLPDLDTVRTSKKNRGIAPHDTHTKEDFKTGFIHPSCRNTSNMI